MKPAIKLASAIAGIVALLIGIFADTTTLWDRFFPQKEESQRSPPTPSPPTTTLQQGSSTEQPMTAQSINGSTSVNANNGSKVTIQQSK